ncbi:MAG: GNAT family N-acetyltransferase [Dehalococcoidia bacterium]|nr:GNAT family N-acetyltransferase [Dehalococcoidia bacterium]
MEITLRRAAADEGPAIGSLHVRGWRWAYPGVVPDEVLATLPEQRYIDYWSRMASELPGEHRLWVADGGGRIVGFAHTAPSDDAEAATGTGEVTAIYLEREWAGAGVGRALFAHAVNDLRRRGFSVATLWVFRDNARARRFYTIAGWREDGGEKLERGAVQVRYRVEFA